MYPSVGLPHFIENQLGQREAAANIIPETIHVNHRPRRLRDNRNLIGMLKNVILMFRIEIFHHSAWDVDRELPHRKGKMNPGSKLFRNPYDIYSVSEYDSF